MATYIEVVDFEKFKEIHTHKLEADAKMLPEDDEVVQVDHVHDVFRVVLLQELQDLQLNTGLVVILLLVPPIWPRMPQRIRRWELRRQ